MHTNAPSIAMPPSNAAWPLMHSRRVLAFAFLLSTALHFFAWLATPYFIQAWREPAAARFDAVLVPIVDSQPISAPVLKASASRGRRATKAVAPKPAPIPRSDTPFAAPENAIAIDRPTETSDENGSIAASASDQKLATAADSNTIAAATPAIVEAITTTIPVALAQKDPEPSPLELPSRISIAYKMTSSISDGVADYKWTRDGDRFEIDSSMQATGFIIGNFVGVLHQVSRGVITPAGLQPSSFQIRRGDAAADTADFLRASNELKLTRGGDSRLLPLPPLIQDMQSFLFQLAFDAPKMQRADDRLEVLVTNARKVYRHRFRQVGIETVETRSGPIESVHLRSEASDPEDTYEVWLAPDNFHLPVKIKFYAGRFPIELIATSIRTTP
ncbi:MAG: DUF3108 domain-containing protein [Betaproteobacteria bacterium]|nr:DUF3108 domain-containing protein [Betaproteobacteria bacterium]